MAKTPPNPKPKPVKDTKAVDALLERMAALDAEAIDADTPKR